MAQKSSSGKAVLILKVDAGWGWVVRDKARPIYPWEINPAPHFRGGSVGPWAGMDGGEEEKAPFPQRRLNPEPSRPEHVAVKSRLFRPHASLTFRHRASCILGQAFHFSPENAFYIFNQQIYFII